ncbi:hypothetical protein ACFFV7_47090 [Nonomuraea spiralis]|uniref:Uncharacterized protein n=1 Tax=Nonomuraea spiralis TaxID=46182 RepID=A0ABV5IY27_9ACTN|nr:hypothetical protein [Nonomuraea spiralis]GGS85311.1 hypothetical protein GCM10010176_031300 [Nonomuraea spiralis]
MGDDTAHPGEAVQARGITSVFPFLSHLAEPEDEPWEFSDRAEYTRRLPGLARRYGITDEPQEHDKPSPARIRRTPWPYGPARGGA